MAYISQVTANKKTILLIDDDDMLTGYVALLLARLGHATQAAHDGLKGLAAAVKYKPDCILLDLGMPEVDGFQFMMHQQKMPEIAKIPVIVMSANHTAEDVKRALNLGAIGYITKPVDEQKLAQRLEKIIPSPLFAPRDKAGVQWARSEYKVQSN